MWISRSLNNLILIFIIQLSPTVISSVGGEERHVTGNEETPHPSVHRHSHNSPFLGDQSSPMNNESSHHINRLRLHHSHGRSSPVGGIGANHPSDLMTTESPRVTYNHLRMVVGAAEGRNPPAHGSAVGENTNHLVEDGPVPTEESISLNSTINPPKVSKKPRWCQNGRILDQCLAQVPPMPDIGIPSSIQAVQTACKAYNVGMGCVDSWSKKCLNPENVKRFQESLSGAHETFAFLCRDPKFRMAYLRHGDCYKKISPKWDECSRNFIEDMKRYHYQGNTTIHCCIRILFLKCVAGISHLYCDRGAAQFLQKMAETLIRTTIKTHTPAQCVKYSPQNCTFLNSSPTLGRNGLSTGFSVVLGALLSHLSLISVSYIGRREVSAMLLIIVPMLMLSLQVFYT